MHGTTTPYRRTGLSAGPRSSASPFLPGKNTIDVGQSSSSRTPVRASGPLSRSGSKAMTDSGTSNYLSSVNANSSRTRQEANGSSPSYTQQQSIEIPQDQFYRTQGASSRTLSEQANSSPSNYRNAASTSGRSAYTTSLARGMKLRSNKTKGPKERNEASPIVIDSDVDEESDVEESMITDKQEHRESRPGPSRSTISPTRTSLLSEQIRNSRFITESTAKTESRLSPTVETGKSFTIALAGDYKKLQDSQKKDSIRSRMQDRNGVVPTEPLRRSRDTRSLVPTDRRTRLGMERPITAPANKTQTASASFSLPLDAIVFDQVCKFEQDENYPKLEYEAPDTFKLTFLFNRKQLTLNLTGKELAGKALMTSILASSKLENCKRIFKFELSAQCVLEKLSDALQGQLRSGMLPSQTVLTSRVDVILFGTRPVEDHRIWKQACETLHSQLSGIDTMHQEQTNRFEVHRGETTSVQEFLLPAKQDDSEMSPVSESVDVKIPPPQSLSGRPRPRPAVKEKTCISLDEVEPETQEERSEKEKSVASARKKGNDRPKFVYPPTQERGRVTLYQSDIDGMQEGEFLNDSIIDFGMKRILETVKANDPLLYNQIHIFSSFFYEVLGAGGDFQSAYARVRKWTNGVDIFAKKFLVVPINAKLHWYLAIVVNPLLALPEEQRMQYLEAVQARQAMSDAAEAKATEDVQMEHADTSTLSTSAVDLDGNGSPMKVSVSPIPPIIDTDEISKTDSDANGLITAEEKRSCETYEVNLDRGSLIGGGPPESGLLKKKGTPITPGESFINDEELPRSVYAEKKYGSSRDARATTITADDFERSPGRLTRSKSNLRTIDLDPIEPVTSAERQRKEETNRREKLEKNCVVLTFDSLKDRHVIVRTVLRKYLQMELNDKFQIDVGPDKLWTVDHIAVAAPQQHNFCDCGLFLLHGFSRFFSESSRFLEEVIPQGKADHPAWKQDERIKSRAWWRSEFEELAKQWEELRRASKRESKALKRDRDDSASDTAAADKDDTETEGGSERKIVKLAPDDGETSKPREQ